MHGFLHADDIGFVHPQRASRLAEPVERRELDRIRLSANNPPERFNGLNGPNGHLVAEAGSCKEARISSKRRTTSSAVTFLGSPFCDRERVCLQTGRDNETALLKRLDGQLGEVDEVRAEGAEIGEVRVDLVIHVIAGVLNDCLREANGFAERLG